MALRLDEDESTRLYPFEWDEYEDRRKALDAEYIRKNIKQLSDKKLIMMHDDHIQLLDEEGLINIVENELA